MKKRLLSFVLSITLGISLAACGGNNAGESSSNNSSAQTNTKSENNTNIDIDNDTDSEEESGVQPAGIITGTYSETIWDGELFGKEMAKYSFFDMVLSEEDKDKYPELAASLEKNAKTEADAAREGMEYLSETYDEYFENVDVTERRELVFLLKEGKMKKEGYHGDGDAPQPEYRF